MKNILKWIGIIVISNFAGLLVVPFIILSSKVDGFWSFALAILTCNIFIRPLYHFIGMLVGGILNLTETQSLWYALLNLLSIIYAYYLAFEVGTSKEVWEIVIYSLFLGGFSMYLFITAPIQLRS